MKSIFVDSEIIVHDPFTNSEVGHFAESEFRRDGYFAGSEVQVDDYFMVRPREWLFRRS